MHFLAKTPFLSVSNKVIYFVNAFQSAALILHLIRSCLGTPLFSEVRPRDLLDLTVNLRFELIRNHKTEVPII